MVRPIFSENTPELKNRLLYLFKYPKCSFILITLLLVGCSPKRLLIDQIGNAFESAGDVYLTENDPQLVKDAFPFNLKTIEILLNEYPENRSLLLAAASSFATYAYAFILDEADRKIAEDVDSGKDLYKRALNLLIRARNYGLKGLKLKYPDIEEWMNTSGAVPVVISKDDVPYLYWTAAAIGGTITASRGNPKYLLDLPKVGWLLNRALELDPTWNKGSLYTAMISYSIKSPDASKQAEDSARDYLRKAVAASSGNDCTPYVTFAETVSIKNQNRAEFIEFLNKALAIDVDIDPGLRLINILAQSRARWLLSRVDELFFLGDI